MLVKLEFQGMICTENCTFGYVDRMGSRVNNEASQRVTLMDPLQSTPNKNVHTCERLRRRDFRIFLRALPVLLTT